MTADSALAQRVVEQLQRSARSVERTSPHDWSLRLRNGRNLTARANLDDDWLTFRATPRTPPSRRQPWQLLALNDVLEGPARLTLSPRSGGPEIRADVALPLDPDGVDVRDACAALLNANAALQEEAEATPRELEPDGTGLQTPALQERLAELGWPASIAPDGRIEIEVRARGVRRAVAVTGFPAVRCAVTIATGDPLDTLRREALGVMLLLASGSTRLVRAAARSREDRDEVRFEVVVTAPTPDRLDHALSALSLACDRFGLEASALHDAALARAYLAAQGAVTESRSRGHGTRRRRSPGSSHSRIGG